jgi:quinol monooxygenase YgiN
VPFAVIARYTCAPEDVEEIRSSLVAMREHTRAEPANLAYEVHQELDEAGRWQPVFVLYEQYVDRAGFDAHAATPHFAEHIVAKVRPRLVHRSVTFADVL